MDLEELIVTYERRVKNLKNENSMTKPLDRVIVAKLLAARKTLNELKLLNIPPVINSLPTREALEDKNELCNSWGNTSHPDECYGQGLEDMYDAMLKVMT